MIWKFWIVMNAVTWMNAVIVMNAVTWNLMNAVTVMNEI